MKTRDILSRSVLCVKKFFINKKINTRVGILSAIHDETTFPFHREIVQ